MKRYTDEKYWDYKHGDLTGAALVIIELTEEYIEKIAILLKNAGAFRAPSIKRALLKDITEMINEL